MSPAPPVCRTGWFCFIFETKEKPAVETLTFLAEEYRQNWQSALGAAGQDPAEQLDAILSADFAPAICAGSSCGLVQLLGRGPI